MAGQNPQHSAARYPARSLDPERAALYLAAVAMLNLKAQPLRSLVDEYGSLRRVLTAPARQIKSLDDRTFTVAAKLRMHVARHEEKAKRQVREAVGAGLQVITWEDDEYPPPLHHDPVGCAPMLFVEGALPPQLRFGSDEVRSCAVVGTRRASPGGKGFTRDLARALAREGILVVSGLAMGIDGAAHEGALQAGVPGGWSEGNAFSPLPDHEGGPVAGQRRYEWGPAVKPTPRPAGTIAVLGGGHKHLHPASHRGLARRILAAGGAILSEWPPDSTPQRHTFLQRNRVISGLSRVVAVVEAGSRSGTNSTVQHALDQGRTVMAAPASPWNVNGVTCLNLLQQGAEPIFGVASVIEQFGQLVPRAEKELEAERRARAPYPEGGQSSQVQASLAFGSAEQGSVNPVRPHELQVNQHAGPSAQTNALQKAMEGGQAVALDSLVAFTGSKPSELMALLAGLELAGLVEVVPGGRYRWRDAGRR